MERKELVVGIKNTLKAVSESIVSAMNEIRMSMNEKVSSIAVLRDNLKEDNEALADIGCAVADFVNDLDEIHANIDNVVIAVDDIIDDLYSVPYDLVVEDDFELQDEDFEEDED
jgi:hypothetical protein